MNQIKDINFAVKKKGKNYRFSFVKVKKWKGERKMQYAGNLVYRISNNESIMVDQKIIISASNKDELIKDLQKIALDLLKQIRR